MRRRVSRFFVCLSLSAVAIARPALAQSGPQDPQPTGSARILGRVVSRDNGSPVRRAHVSLEGLPADMQSTDPKRAHIQRDVETDDNGAFDFARIPAGSYRISVPATNGFLALARAREAIVGDGQALEVAIRLERTGAIAGRITDKNGAGLVGVEVQALRRNDFHGHVTVMPTYTYGYGARASTNDLGEFRLFNLTPGEYVVVATPVYLSREQGPRRRFGFLTTYYPGAQALKDARLIVVRSGKDVARVNFSLASGTLATVTINALDSGELPLGRDASATLSVLSDLWFSSPESMRQASRGDDGSFVFTDVPLGDYYVIVSTSRLQEATYVNLRIDGDVALKVQTNTGAKVSGRFVVQGPQRDANTPFPNAEVTATPPLHQYGPSYTRDVVARTEGTDKFELTGLRGPMVLHAYMSPALLVSISRAGGNDLAGKPIHFTGAEIIDDLLVVFTYEKAEVNVTLTGLREPDDPENVLVILFPEDPARWHAGWLTYTAIQSSKEMAVQPVAAGRVTRPAGRTFTFSLGPVIPGRYLIAAVPSPDVMDATEPAILERLRLFAMPVTLVADQTVKVEVAVTR